VVTPEERRKRDVKTILQAHLTVAGTDGRYQTRCVVMKKGKRTEFFDDEGHFGLLCTGKGAVKLVPQYRNDGTVSAIRFRKVDKDECRLLQNRFEGWFKKATDLSAFLKEQTS
jgi:hypothetical protein